MADQSFLAKLGLRLGVVGSAAALAIAAPIANADYSTTANTAANRTGWYFDQTAAAEKVGMIVGGQAGPLYTRNGSVVDVLFNGQVTIGNGLTVANLLINGAAGTNRVVDMQTAGILRWRVGANSTAETGSDAGSDYIIQAYSDTGVIIDTPLTITRMAGGVVTTVRSFVISTGATPSTLAIQSNAGTVRALTFSTGSSVRWQQVANATSESGSNAGSDYELIAYDDTGVLIDKPMSIIRAALGAMTITRTIFTNAGTLTGTQVILNTSGTWNNSSSTFTGWLLNITDTASTSSSLLLDIQTSSSSKFSIRKQGTIISTIFDTDLLGTVGSYAIVRTTILTASITDGIQVVITPTINGAFTVTRMNYINLANPAGTSTVTDGCVFRFNAAAGTHKAVDGSSAKTSPGTVSAWMKHNVNGTIYFQPLYTSKTS